MAVDLIARGIAIQNGTPTTTGATSEVIGAASSGSNNIIIFDGTSGKILKDSGKRTTDFVAVNATITGGTHTKITYDSKGLVTIGDHAVTSDIDDTLNRRYVTDQEKININYLTGLTSNVQQHITDEANARILGDVTNYNLITGETATRTASDLTNYNNITGLTATVTNNYNLLTGETSDRIFGDIVNYNLITGLTSTVTDNYNLLTGETADRISGDTAINVRIDDVILKTKQISTGAIIAPTITDNGNGTATISSTTFNIYPNSTFSGNMVTVVVPEATLTFTDNSEEYISVRYNSGNTIYFKETVGTIMNHSDILPVFVVWRLLNTCHSLGFDSLGVGLANKLQSSTYHTNEYKISSDGGLVITESITPTPRTVVMTGGLVYTGAIAQTVDNFNSSTDKMTLAYHSGGTWVYSDNLVYNNTQYDNGTNLALINTNKYSVRWFYRSIGDSKQIFYVLGSDGSYTNISDASNELPRTDLPKIITHHCMLVGRAIVKESATSGVMSTTLVTSFGISTTINHDDTANISIATSGVTYGHINDQAQTIAGTKTFTSPTINPQGIIIEKTSGTGIKVDSVTPTFGWKDLIGTINVRVSGTNPTFAVYSGNIWQYSFGTANGQTDVFNEFHVPHDYVPGSDMFAHTHWSTITTPTGVANWLFDVIYSKGYSQAQFATPITISVAQTAIATAFTHQIAEVQMSAPNGLISSAVNVSITSGSATLTSATALFTSADIGRTIRVVGAGAAGGNLNTTINAFTSTTSVTLANTAGTSVTSQPNFNYRVIDSNLFEIDGVIIVRTWRDAQRTADTLNVAPFLHFVDCHYQSTQMSTKTKNYPFYT